MKSFGGIAFMVGLVLAVIIAIFSASSAPIWAVYVLAILGLIVGLFNVTDSEISNYLIASIAFLLSFTALSSVFTVLTFGWDAVPTFFSLMTVFVAPGTAVVALKVLYETTKD